MFSVYTTMSRREREMEVDKAKAEDAGMDGHIAKPIDVGIMQTTLRDVLNRKKE